ncbi:TetR/AcrR family transcriptional regulator [Kitasatospora cheerisanensis]|nr:TetR/AcrR family transcriptional regulator [Kitasatospora cheerisanensis]
MGLRETKKQQTRTAIADAALPLFLDRGFDRVTVAEVARHANVSTNTVFNYFATKEDLFFDRQAEVEQHLATVVRERPPGTCPVAAIRDDLRTALEGGRIPGDAAFFRAVEASPALRAREREIAEHAETALAAALPPSPPPPTSPRPSPPPTAPPTAPSATTSSPATRRTPSPTTSPPPPPPPSTGSAAARNTPDGPADGGGGGRRSPTHTPRGGTPDTTRVRPRRTGPAPLARCAFFLPHLLRLQRPLRAAGFVAALPRPRRAAGLRDLTWLCREAKVSRTI